MGVCLSAFLDIGTYGNKSLYHLLICPSGSQVSKQIGPSRGRRQQLLPEMPPGGRNGERNECIPRLRLDAPDHVCGNNGFHCYECINPRN